MSNILIAMYGLPRSGKSTLSKQLAKKLGAPMVNRDSVRLALHGTRYLAKPEPYVKLISYTMIEALFIAGHEIIVCDETNYSQATRDAIKSPMWETYFLPVETPPDICKERAIATGQPDLIAVIDAMWARREPLGPTDLIWSGNVK